VVQNLKFKRQQSPRTRFRPILLCDKLDFPENFVELARRSSNPPRFAQFDLLQSSRTAHLSGLATKCATSAAGFEPLFKFDEQPPDLWKRINVDSRGRDLPSLDHNERMTSPKSRSLTVRAIEMSCARPSRQGKLHGNLPSDAQ